MKKTNNCISKHTYVCKRCRTAIKPEIVKKLVTVRNGGKICAVDNCGGHVLKIDTLALGIWSVLEGRGYGVLSIEIDLPTQASQRIRIVLDKHYSISPLPCDFYHSPFPGESKRDTTPIEICWYSSDRQYYLDDPYMAWSKAYTDITRWALAMPFPVNYSRQ